MAPFLLRSPKNREIASAVAPTWDQAQVSYKSAGPEAGRPTYQKNKETKNKK